MSATLDSDLFANYFAQPIGEVFEPAPVISVEGSIFSVSEYYVEDLKQLGPVSFSFFFYMQRILYYLTLFFINH